MPADRVALSQLARGGANPTKRHPPLHHHLGEYELPARCLNGPRSAPTAAQPSRVGCLAACRRLVASFVALY